jgi:hypothetical protein
VLRGESAPAAELTRALAGTSSTRSSAGCSASGARRACLLPLRRCRDQPAGTWPACPAPTRSSPCSSCTTPRSRGRSGPPCCSSSHCWPSTTCGTRPTRRRTASVRCAGAQPAVAVSRPPLTLARAVASTSSAGRSLSFPGARRSPSAAGARPHADHGRRRGTLKEPIKSIRTKQASAARARPCPQRRQLASLHGAPAPRCCRAMSCWSTAGGRTRARFTTPVRLRRALLTRVIVRDRPARAAGDALMAVLWGLCCGVDYLLPFYYFFFFSGVRRRLARPPRAQSCHPLHRVRPRRWLTAGGGRAQALSPTAPSATSSGARRSTALTGSATPSWCAPALRGALLTHHGRCPTLSFPECTD